MKKQDLREELAEVSPLLEGLKNRASEGFQVPENYFQTLENQVFEKIDALGERRAAVPAEAGWKVWVRQLRPYQIAVAAAASLALAFGAWHFFKNENPAEMTSLAAVEISPEDAESFVLENVQDFDPQQIAMETNDLPLDLPADSISTETRFQTEDVEGLLDELSDEELEELF